MKKFIILALIAIITLPAVAEEVIIFSEDFSSITDGDNLSTTGSNYVWTKNDNFVGSSYVYKAGGAVRLGTDSNIGSLTTKTLDLSVNNGYIKVAFDVKGWTTVEGEIKVTIGNAYRTIPYTAKMNDGFETITVEFYNCIANSTIKFETTAKRAFLDNIKVYYEDGTPGHTITPPTFSPNGGTFFSEQAVTISADAALILYTTDGSNPSYINEIGEIYDNPITISYSCVLKAIAVDDEGNESIITAAEYIIEDPDEEYAIVTQKGDKWYAASTAINSSNKLPAVQVEVNDKIAYYVGTEDITWYWNSSKGTLKNSEGNLLVASGSGNTNLKYSSTTNYRWNIEEKYGLVYSAYTGRVLISNGTVFGNYDKSHLGNPSYSSKSQLMKICKKVSIPRFSPTEGLYHNTQTVTITCFPQSATIYYTTDGSEPNTNSNIYEGPIEVSSSTTIKAIGVKEGFENSDVAEAEYTIIPVNAISVTGSPEEFWKGDEFNHDGMTVTAYFEDETEEDVTVHSTFSEPDMTIAGEKTITVTYKGKETSYTIDVQTIENTEETAYTVAEAVALIDAGKDLNTKVYVKGYVSSVETAFSGGYSTFNISADGKTTGQQFKFYKNQETATETYDSDPQIEVEEEVVGYGELYLFNNTTYEFKQGNYLVSRISPTTATCSITWSVNGTPMEVADEVATQKRKIQILMPPAPEPIKGRTFRGWTIAETVNIDGAGIEYLNTLSKVPEVAEVTYYAVFAKETSGGEATEWVRVDNVNDLSAGDEVTIVSGSVVKYNVSTTSTQAATGHVAISSQRPNNWMAVPVEVNGNKLTSADNVQSFTLEATPYTDHPWAFRYDGGYLVNLAQSSNRMGTSESISNASSFSISINDDGVTKVKGYVDFDRKYIKVNGNHMNSVGKDNVPLVSCYNYDGSPNIVHPSIYKRCGGTTYSDYLTIVTYSRSVTAGNYGTICLPHKVDKDDHEGVAFFNVEALIIDDSNQITGISVVEEEGDIIAGKPYIILTENPNFTVAYSGEPVTNPIEANGLIGNLTPAKIEVPQGCYILSNNQIRMVAGGKATVGQYKAYLDLDKVEKVNNASAKSVIIDNSGIVSGIEEIGTEQYDEQKYNIMGQRVNAVGRGVYIINGRKHVVR